jgi:hypothetical protein
MAQSETCSSTARIIRAPPPAAPVPSRDRTAAAAFTAMTAAIVAAVVATIDVPMMSVGFCEPAAASTPIIVAGMSCTPDVVIARNVTIGFVAVSWSLLSVCIDSIALMPSGVAALASPSMLAATASTMAPAAGCVGGISGNSHRSTGRSARPSRATRPAASATRIIPSHRVMMPTRPIAIWTAVDADSTAPRVTPPPCR